MNILTNDFNKMKKSLMETRNISDKQATEFLISLGPKKLFKMGLLEMHGWRESYTKKPVEKRKKERRKKNKLAAKSRKVNR